MRLQVPPAYRPENAAPLVVLLHGYGADGFFQQQYFRLGRLVEEYGVLLLAPDGTPDDASRRFWSAFPSCCNFGGLPVDDVAYVRGLIEEVKGEYAVDPARVFLVGHSNGGFMSHRLACEAADLVAGIVSLAGSTVDDAAECRPSRPVSILNIHGDADETILYEGGSIFDQPYPGAIETLERWAAYNGCAPERTSAGDPLNLENRIGGNETLRFAHEGCNEGVGVELWQIPGGGHLPTLVRPFPDLIWEWLNARPRL